MYEQVKRRFCAVSQDTGPSSLSSATPPLFSELELRRLTSDMRFVGHIDRGSRAETEELVLPSGRFLSSAPHELRGAMPGVFRFLDTGRRPENGLARQFLQAHSADGASSLLPARPEPRPRDAQGDHRGVAPAR